MRQWEAMGGNGKSGMFQNADVDECATPNTCSQICVNQEGGFQCECNVGAELAPDRTTCLSESHNTGYYYMLHNYCHINLSDITVDQRGNQGTGSPTPGMLKLVRYIHVTIM